MALVSNLYYSAKCFVGVNKYYPLCSRLGNKDNGQVDNRLIRKEANPVENKQKQAAGITIRCFAKANWLRFSLHKAIAKPYPPIIK